MGYDPEKIILCGESAGATLVLDIGKDMIHTYPLDLWGYPEAMTAFEEMELFIRQLVG